MSNNSKAKLISDVLQSNVSQWWGWDSILEELIPGFLNVPGRIQGEIISTYMTYVPHVFNECDERGIFVLTDGRAQERRFKIATDAPEDKPEIAKRIVIMKKRENAIASKMELRIRNLKDQKILPKNWSPSQFLLNK